VPLVYHLKFAVNPRFTTDPRLTILYVSRTLRARIKNQKIKSDAIGKSI